MSERCPFCNSKVNDADSICPACQSPLEVECPYCKQTIKAYDEVCPFCTTRLVKKDYSTPMVILATIMSASWCIGNVLLLALFTKFPKIFATSDEKSANQEFWVADYERLCMYGLAIPFILFIIIAITKLKYRNYAIAGIVINCVLFLIFSCYALFLKLHFT